MRCIRKVVVIFGLQEDADPSERVNSVGLFRLPVLWLYDSISGSSVIDSSSWNLSEQRTVRDLSNCVITQSLSSAISR